MIEIVGNTEHRAFDSCVDILISEGFLVIAEEASTQSRQSPVSLFVSLRPNISVVMH